MTSRRAGVAAVACAASVLVAGCSASGTSAESGVSGVPTRPGEPPAAAQSGTVGGQDSPCALPVVFGIAESWKPEAVPADVLPALPPRLADRFRRGDFVSRCEVSGSATGSASALRVYVNDKRYPDAEQALQAFVKATPQAQKVENGPVNNDGSLPSAEATYLNGHPDYPSREHAVAVLVPHATVVIALTMAEKSSEKSKILPAYVLAKHTLTPAE
ncbi:hypothetical protein GCM10012275_60510 [Longimycelium tulufanense]|uniref:Lipoprotein LpqN n=1 Tax=Longimycelium tulufanense TaxID=907463 RepID=A0A8J3CKS1_9PSEU|nr:lipoprotein [Longimycelium tulufanense]GGM81804.1 hypothetical protein GCM10012275_60510 [Longimycelium tulufanense]